MPDPDPRDRPRSRPPPAAASSSNPPDTFLKRQLDAANKEKTDLQTRVRHLDSQNMALLKSLFEVSAVAPGRQPPKPLPVDILTALRQLSVAAENPPPPAGKGSAYRRSAPDRRPSTTTAPDTGVQPRVSAAYAPFRARADLVGHASAVYAVQFSPNGTLLVSASFDRSLRLWPVTRLLDRAATDDRASIPDAHHAPVTAVEWAFDSARVVSGGLDQTAAEWDVHAGSREAIVRFAVDGLVNAVSVSPANDNIFFVATSRRAVHMFDRRERPASSAPVPSGSISGLPPSTTSRAVGGGDIRRSVIVDNDASVNTVHITLDGHRFITGDHAGAIKTWELRGGRGGSSGTGGSGGGGEGHCVPYSVGLLDSIPNDDARRPITHIHTAPPLSGEEHGRFMAVNSYDSFLRVYDRGTCLLREARPGALRPVQAFRGVIGAHWPIKSSFFLGADYRPAAGTSARALRRAARRRRRNTRDRVSESRSSARSEAGDARAHAEAAVDDDGEAGNNRGSGVSAGSDDSSSSDGDDGSCSGDEEEVDSETSSGDGNEDGGGGGGGGGGRTRGQRSSSVGARRRRGTRGGNGGDGAGGGDGGGSGGGGDGGGGDAGSASATAGRGQGGGGSHQTPRPADHREAGGGQRVEEFGETIGSAVQKSLILASGSSDGRVYIFDVSARAGRGGLLQTLDGHRDRVYAVDFHPSEPLLASCSADSHVKIWQSQSR